MSVSVARNKNKRGKEKNEHEAEQDKTVKDFSSGGRTNKLAFSAELRLEEFQVFWYLLLGVPLSVQLSWSLLSPQRQLWQLAGKQENRKTSRIIITVRKHYSLKLRQ